MTNHCYCGKEASFESCCKPFIEGLSDAPDPESLMRSRYSAYVTKDFPYILKTYAQQQRENLSISELSQDADSTTWLKLVVEGAESTSDKNTVTFSAFYRLGGQFYKLHECSSFVLEDGKWRYTSGEMFSDSGHIKTQRNMPCICGSGLKFKRCCGK